MKNRFKLMIIVMLFLTIFGFGQTQQRKPTKALTQEDQKKFLSTRLPGNTIEGTFDSYCSFLYGAINVSIHTEDKEINKTHLNSPFPEFYLPTWRELFDTIAEQTRSSWKYDPNLDYWVFSKPSMAKPYSIVVADNWVSSDEGASVAYKPQSNPVGMMIYYKGSYSSDDATKRVELNLKIRDTWAVIFAGGFGVDNSVTSMRKTTVAETEALYFESPVPASGYIRRQWALVKDGKAFIIVSTLRSGQKQLLSDVDVMVKSFRVTSTDEATH